MPKGARGDLGCLDRRVAGDSLNLCFRRKRHALDSLRVLTNPRATCCAGGLFRVNQEQVSISHCYVTLVSAQMPKSGIRSRHFVKEVPASLSSFCQKRAAVGLFTYQCRRAPQGKHGQPIPPEVRETSAAQSPGYAFSLFFNAKPLAQPPCNSPASARFDFPSARRSISRRASDSGRFSSLQIGTALQSASIEPRSAGSDASGVCLAWG